MNREVRTASGQFFVTGGILGAIGGQFFLVSRIFCVMRRGLHLPDEQESITREELRTPNKKVYQANLVKAQSRMLYGPYSSHLFQPFRKIEPISIYDSDRTSLELPAFETGVSAL
jgi:hypothetical protein